MGFGLNKGFTEAMIAKMYSDNIEFHRFEKDIALLLERIFGTEIMKYFYFNADLNGFKKALSYELDHSSADSFIDELDYLSCSNELTILNDFKEKILDLCGTHNIDPNEVDKIFKYRQNKTY